MEPKGGKNICKIRSMFVFWERKILILFQQVLKVLLIKKMEVRTNGQDTCGMFLQWFLEFGIALEAQISLFWGLIYTQAGTIQTLSIGDSLFTHIHILH